jgi:hypothetical protein
LTLGGNTYLIRSSLAIIVWTPSRPPVLFPNLTMLSGTKASPCWNIVSDHTCWTIYFYSIRNNITCKMSIIYIIMSNMQKKHYLKHFLLSIALPQLWCVLQILANGQESRDSSSLLENQIQKAKTERKLLKSVLFIRKYQDGKITSVKLNLEIINLLRLVQWTFSTIERSSERKFNSTKSKLILTCIWRFRGTKFLRHFTMYTAISDHSFHLSWDFVLALQNGYAWPLFPRFLCTYS